MTDDDGPVVVRISIMQLAESVSGSINQVLAQLTS
jgi:hypothetical protein